MGTYTVMDYLLDRLADLGVDRLFGVPGDFTLAMLDRVESHDRVSWVGCANELGAGYAADGYARMRGLGALCTTFGVGELSAINAVAGSFAEHVPVLHIVGAPTLATQAAGRATHHSLGDGDFRHFARMSAEVSCASAALSAETATEEIDHLLAEVQERRLPGYLLMPADVAASAAQPASGPVPEHPGVSNVESLEDFTAAAAELIGSATSVSVLADILVERMGARPQLDRLLALGLPHATLLWGRRVVDESAPGYLGSYVGAVSAEEVRHAIEDADLLIEAGVQFTDLTSGFFSQRLPDERTIEIQGRSARVGDTVYAPVAMADALNRLTALLAPAQHRLERTESDAPLAPQVDVEPEHTGTSALDQHTLWNAVSRALRPGDLVLADQGTAFYGMGAHRLPHDVVFIGQPLWASIGYTLPALLGAALGAPQRRPIVLIGDGAAQLTIAELGTLVRNRVPALVLVVNNEGYTVERAIHGANAGYNDITPWNWSGMLRALDADRWARFARAETVAQLDAALELVAEHAERLVLVEAVVPKLDVPPLLTALAQAAAAANRGRR